MMDGYQKASKTYDALMRSGNFTAVQNKNNNGSFVDSIGELVALCEKDGYIEKYYIDSPKDKVDETLIDTKRYIHDLIIEETNLNDILETTISRNQREDAAEAETPDEVLDEDKTIEDIEQEIKGNIEQEIEDEDFIDFNNFLEEDAGGDYGT